MHLKCCVPSYTGCSKLSVHVSLLVGVRVALACALSSCALCSSFRRNHFSFACATLFYAPCLLRRRTLVAVACAFRNRVRLSPSRALVSLAFAWLLYVRLLPFLPSSSFPPVLSSSFSPSVICCPPVVASPSFRLRILSSCCGVSFLPSSSFVVLLWLSLPFLSSLVLLHPPQLRMSREIARLWISSLIHDVLKYPVSGSYRFDGVTIFSLPERFLLSLSASFESDEDADEVFVELVEDVLD